MTTFNRENIDKKGGKESEKPQGTQRSPLAPPWHACPITAPKMAMALQHLKAHSHKGKWKKTMKRDSKAVERRKQ